METRLETPCWVKECEWSEQADTGHTTLQDTCLLQPEGFTGSWCSSRKWPVTQPWPSGMAHTVATLAAVQKDQRNRPHADPRRGIASKHPAISICHVTKYQHVLAFRESSYSVYTMTTQTFSNISRRMLCFCWFLPSVVDKATFKIIDKSFLARHFHRATYSVRQFVYSTRLFPMMVYDYPVLKL